MARIPVICVAPWEKRDEWAWRHPARSPTSPFAQATASRSDNAGSLRRLAIPGRAGNATVRTRVRRSPRPPNVLRGEYAGALKDSWPHPQALATLAEKQNTRYLAPRRHATPRPRDAGNRSGTAPPRGPDKRRAPGQSGDVCAQRLPCDGFAGIGRVDLGSARKVPSPPGEYSRIAARRNRPDSFR